ncbi:MAG: YggS family pyridoxal phosphate-dependent enzyme [Pseudomonadota bacterium]
MSLSDITQRIGNAAKSEGRDPKDVDLIAVSKVQPNERVAAVLEAGHRLFGENKVQEAAGKWPSFQEQYPDAQVHLLGPLQTNKARQAMSLFSAIHSLDRPKLANTLTRLAQEMGSCPDLFIQVNTGDEAQKAGVALEELDGFVADCRASDLPVVGLMCLPPQAEEPALHFALLAKLAERNGLSGLSMGMSGDFETAVQFGATHVRVGSAIFGDRTYN